MTKKNKTKEELLKEIDEKEKNISDLLDQIDRLEKYKKYEETAEEMKTIYDSYILAGFSADQAFRLLLAMFNNVLKNCH